jgi:AcrR family transcriptional regulator
MILPEKERCSFMCIKGTPFVARASIGSVPSRRSPAVERQPLTIERIARAALDIVEESGYPAVSMRAVADRLNTGQASLYVHVRGKADLDRIMVERVMAEIGRPAGGSWREQLASEAARTLEVYARYPGLATASFASLPSTEEYADGLEERLAMLCSLGLDLRQAQAADLAVGLLTTARATEDAVIAERIAESGLTSDEWWLRVRGVLASDEARPLTARSADYLNPEDRASMTVELVQLVLDGIQARYGV